MGDSKWKCQLISVMCKGGTPMTRHVLAILALGALAAIPFAPSPQAAAQSSDLPLIDAHDHLQANTSAESIIKLMDLMEISRMVLMALSWDPERGSDSQALEYARRYPGRFIPFIGMQRPGSYVRPPWMDVNNKWAVATLADVENKLKGGGFFGIGEIIVRHYDYRVINGPGELDNPPDSPGMLRLSELATQYKVPMIIHAEGEPVAVAKMEHLMTAYPDARIIWAHYCGRQSAARIRTLLGAHPNLYCDLAGMTGVVSYGTGWPRKEPWTFLVEDGAGHLLPEVQQLFEAFPDRFLGVGMDSAHYQTWGYFVPQIQRFRVLLSQLSPTTANKMAHENAERLFGLSPNGK